MLQETIEFDGWKWELIMRPTGVLADGGDPIPTLRLSRDGTVLNIGLPSVDCVFKMGVE